MRGKWVEAKYMGGAGQWEIVYNGQDQNVWKKGTLNRR